MSFKTIRVALELDERGFSVKTQRAGKTVRSLRKEFDRTSQSLRRMEHHLGSTVARVRDFLIVTSVMSRGLQTLGRYTLGWQYSVINTNAEIERMTMLLRGMSKGVTEIERSAEAADSVREMFAMAKSTPYSINQLTNTFVKFRSVGIEPMDGSLRALTDAVASFGGDEQTLHRASVAIQQMAGKGVISMEELRQQLGEAVPNAIGLMARSMGVSYQELVSMVSRGQVEAKTALALTFDEMERTLGGSGQRMMSTWTGMMSILSTQWTEFQVEIGGGQDDGFFAVAKDALQDLILMMSGTEVKNFAQNLGDGMASFVNVTRAGVEWVIEFRDEIALAAKMVLGLWVAVKAGIVLIALVRSLRAARVSAIMYGRSMLASSGHTRLFIRENKTLALRLGMTAKASKLAGAAMYAMGGPIGIVTGLLAFGITQWALYGNAAEDALERASKGQHDASKEDLEATKKAIEEKTKLIERAERHIQHVEAQKWHHQANKDESLALKNEHLKKLQRERELLNVNYWDSLTEMEERQAEIGRARNKRELQAQLDAARSSYDEQMKFMDEALQGGFSKDAVHQEQEVAVRELYTNLIKVHQDNAKRLQASLDSNLIPDELVLQTKAKIEDSEKAVEEYGDTLAKQLERLKSGPLLTDGTMAKDPVSSLKTYLDGLVRKTAMARAEIGGMSGEVEKFNSMIKGMSEADFIDKFKMTFAEARVIVQNFTNATKELKTTKADLKATETGWSNLGTALNGAAIDFEEAMSLIKSGGNAADGGRVAALRKQLEKIVEAMPAAQRELVKLSGIMDTTVNMATNARTAKYVADMQERTNAIKRGLLSEKDQIKANYEYELNIARQRVDTSKMNANEKAAIEERYYAYLTALQEKFVRDSEGPIKAMLRQWQDTSSALEGAAVSWIDGAANALTDFVMTGKSSFKELANSIISDLIRIQIRQQMVGLFSSLGGSSVNSMISGQTGYTGGTAGVLSGDEFAKFATGGVMTKYGKAMMRSYATGGIANSPQIALYGEGSMNEAYVPLPDGKTIPVTMKGGMGDVVVNVINQTSQPVDATQGQPRFDGEQMILDVVLKAAGRPGQFRDGMKGAMS